MTAVLEQEPPAPPHSKRRWRRLARVGRLVALLPPLIGVSGLLWLVTRDEPAGFDTREASRIGYTPLEQLVPGPGLPGSLELKSSNNNVDVAHFEDRFFLAFRTAPTHFASKITRIYLLSSADRKTWGKEAEFQVGQSDLREPRFLRFNGKLFFYFFRAGHNPVRFEPDFIHVSERGADGSWSAPKPIFQKGYVDWRVKEHNGLAYMSVYRGEGIYTTKQRSGEVRLLTSTDGYDWKPISEAPQVTDPGAEEMEFAFDNEGNLVATVRLEVKGGLVCTASKDDLSLFTTRFTPYKYDSALMLTHGDDFYVVARRNVAGPFNRGLEWLPERWQRGWYLFRYSFTRKRTALYKVNVAERTLAPVLDFPSKGDTAFAGAVPLDADRYWLVNYSSPLDGPDWPWMGGQLFGSRLYETELTFNAKN